MKTYWLILLVLLFNLTLLLVNDYYPGVLASLDIPPIMLFIATGFMLVFAFFRMHPEKDKRLMLIFPFAFVAYPLALMGILTLLGGTSRNNFTLANPLTWITTVVLLGTFWSGYVQAAKQEAAERQKTASQEADELQPDKNR